MWLTVALCLAIGWLIASGVLGRTESVGDVAGGALRIPTSWVRTSEDGAVFAATDVNGGAYGSRISVRTATSADLVPPNAFPADQPPSPEATLNLAATNWSLIRGQDLEGYRILRIEPTTVAGRPAMAIEYAYLTDPPQAVGAGLMPGLMHAIDTVVANGDQFTILTVAVEQGNEGQLIDLNNRTLAGWQVP
jgi:hypothetical protein